MRHHVELILQNRNVPDGNFELEDHPWVFFFLFRMWRALLYEHHQSEVTSRNSLLRRQKFFPRLTSSHSCECGVMSLRSPHTGPGPHSWGWSCGTAQFRIESVRVEVLNVLQCVCSAGSTPPLSPPAFGRERRSRPLLSTLSAPDRLILAKRYSNRSLYVRPCVSPLQQEKRPKNRLWGKKRGKKKALVSVCYARTFFFPLSICFFVWRLCAPRLQTCILSRKLIARAWPT